MKFLVCNDIGALEQVLSTKVEQCFGVLWAELSIWVAVTFSSFWGADLETTFPTKLPFLSAPHSCTVLNFCQILSRFKKVSI